LFLLVTTGCHWPGKPNPDERPVPAEFVLAFDALFKRNCAGCHGADGTLGPAPPLKNALFRAGVPEEELKRVISKGRRSGAGTAHDPPTSMPAFLKANGGTLSEAQVQVLVYEIKGIRYKVERESEAYDAKVTVVADKEGTVPAWGETSARPKDLPLYLASKAGNNKRGADVFARACAMCHGDDGKGVKQDDKFVSVLNDPAFLTLISDRALRRIAITGRPDLGMPSYAESGPGGERGPDFEPLTSEEITNLVALLASWRPAEVARRK